MLKVGDVFKLENGMKVYGKIPSKFVTSNRRFSDELTKTELVVGKHYHNETRVTSNVNSIVRDVVKAFEYEGATITNEQAKAFVEGIIQTPTSETFKLEPGEFLVVEAKMEGGGTGHGPHDIYPDGWHVTCKKLNEWGEYDKDGIEISFYQSGCFTCVIEKIEVIRKKEVKVTYE